MSRNRLNVAISRAQCLAYLVCSPHLLEVDCRTIEQMRLANALCRFVERADSAVGAPLAEPSLYPLSYGGAKYGDLQGFPGNWCIGSVLYPIV
jgi:hypothetical protein